MLKNDFVMSCDLLMKMAKESVRFQIKMLPKWLQRILVRWYRDFEEDLC
jgi:hypothetical protein